MDQLPRTPTGKVQRFKLRELPRRDPGGVLEDLLKAPLVLCAWHLAARRARRLRERAAAPARAARGV